MKRIKHKKAFTLIELLVVIAIIMVLMAAGIVSYTNAQKSGRDAKRKADLKQIQSALEMYRADKGHYPILSMGAGGDVVKLTTLIDPPNPPMVGVNLYISSIPSDSTSGNYYYYISGGVGENYHICTHLENPQVGDSCPTGTVSCGTTDNCNYGSTSP